MNYGVESRGGAPYTTARRGRSDGPNTGLLKAQRMRAGTARRTGLVGWWLNLTAPPAPQRVLPLAQREQLRKAELTSFSIVAVFLFLVALVSNSLAHPSTAEAVGIMAVGLVIAALLNRSGLTRAAAYLIPSLLMVLIALAVVGTKGGLELAMLPAYDLFVLPIFLISLIGDRKAPWAFALAAIAFIVGDFALQPHALITSAGASHFDSISYLVTAVTWWGGINRHVALALFAAFFGWLGARSVEAAMRRADQAEELAALEHAVAEQRRQLEYGVQQLLETHVRIANGDFNARAPLHQDHQLWQVAASLNNLLGRLQKAGLAEHQLRRTHEELQRLAAAMDSARMGRHPIWPAPSGTLADSMIERVVPRQRPPAQPWPSSYTQTDLPPIAAQAAPRTGAMPRPFPAAGSPPTFQSMPAYAPPRRAAPAPAPAVQEPAPYSGERMRRSSPPVVPAAPLTSDATPVWPSPDRNSMPPASAPWVTSEPSMSSPVAAAAEPSQEDPEPAETLE